MDERNWDRHLVEKEVPCTMAGMRSSVFLYDLSAGGCMIELADSRSALGASIAIDLHEPEMTHGEVVWQSGRCVGVRFGVPLHEAVVRHVGFTPPEVPFELQAPRDRFGRVLPPIDAGEGYRLGL